MRILVLRFSAMGDVALLTPVFHSLAKKYSSLSITLVTRKKFEPFFYNIPGIEVIGIDVEREYRGLRGLFRLFRELRSLGPYQGGVDVHGSLRSSILRLFFLFTGLKFSLINKGRKEKRAHTRRKNKKLNRLPHTVLRYMKAFEQIGIYATIEPGPWINPDTQSRALAHQFLKNIGIKKKENFWIGIAPFAGHEQKMWPLKSMLELIRIIRTNLDASIFLFGGNENEINILSEWKYSMSDLHLVAGILSLEGELALILRLDIMVAMDSLNMHLAALQGIPLLSIWGATHTHSGFGPFGQAEESIVEISPDRLRCRPCSIFGNKPCFRHDLACMNWIKPNQIYHRLLLRLFHDDQEYNAPETD